MKQKISFSLFTIFVFCFWQNLSAQILSEIDSTRVKIAEPIHLKILIKKTANQKITFPSSDTLNAGIEVLSTRTDSSSKDGKIFIQKTLELTHFEPGKYLLHPLKIKVDQKEYATPSYELEFLDVVIDSTQQSMYPVKGIMSEKYTLKDYLLLYWKYILAGILLLLLVISLLILFGKRKQRTTTVDKYHGLSAFEAAQQKLKELHEKEYIETKKSKAFYVELNDIVKEYFGKELRFRYKQTLNRSLFKKVEKSKKLDYHSLNQLEEFLDTANAVKFAKHLPKRKQMHRDFDTVDQIIEMAHNGNQ